MTRLIKLKGRFHFRQFFPSKPGRLKIKAFTLAEPTSGYVLGSKVYTGKEVGVVEKDLGEKAVMSLMEPFVNDIIYSWTIIILNIYMVCLRS